ncbi:MAG: DUF6605 domain-containing protein [Pirellulaceae bacterium]
MQVSFNQSVAKYCQILDAPLSIGSGVFLVGISFRVLSRARGLRCRLHFQHPIYRGTTQLLRGGFLSVGHDEYWSIEMFHAMQAAIAAGVSVGFFSGDAVFGRIVWDVATRSLRRVGVFGPPDGTREFESMDSLEHTRPYGNELMGAHSTGQVSGGADWVCTLPEHWLYAKTGMKLGDAIPGVIGWEYHGDPADIAGLEIVAQAPTQTAPGELNGDEYTATVYPGPKNNIVFNASTCWWADGLSEPPGYVRPSVYTSPQGPDGRIQQITRNVLDRMA